MKTIINLKKEDHEMSTSCLKVGYCIGIITVNGSAVWIMVSTISDHFKTTYAGL